jgi:hypothetical protein
LPGCVPSALRWLPTPGSFFASVVLVAVGFVAGVVLADDVVDAGVVLADDVFGWDWTLNGVLVEWPGAAVSAWLV